MKQYNRYMMDPDGKWTRASLLCMAGALFSFADLGNRGNDHFFFSRSGRIKPERINSPTPVQIAMSAMLKT